MKVSMIVAYGKNYQIGLNNALLWHIPEDLKNFKRLTNGHHILMGRKTFESIGFPLPNRTSVVLSQNGFSFDGVHTFKEIQEALDFCKQNEEEEVYKNISVGHNYVASFSYVILFLLALVQIFTGFGLYAPT